MNRFDMMEKLQEIMGSEELLDELVRAMSEDEARENFEYIARMNDIELEEE